MEELTVNALLKQLQSLKKAGYGDAKIITPTDDEGNDYRVLYFNVDTIDLELTESISYVNPDLGNQINDNPKEFVILG